MVGGMQVPVLVLVDLVLYEPTPRQAREAQELQREVEVAIVVLFECLLAGGFSLERNEVFANSDCNARGKDGQRTESGKGLVDRDIAKPALLTSCGVEILSIGCAEAVPREVLH